MISQEKIFLMNIRFCDWFEIIKHLYRDRLRFGKFIRTILLSFGRLDGLIVKWVTTLAQKWCSLKIRIVSKSVNSECVSKLWKMPRLFSKVSHSGNSENSKAHPHSRYKQTCTFDRILYVSFKTFKVYKGKIMFCKPIYVQCIASVKDFTARI